MRLLLLRHAPADPATAQLTDAGRREMRRVIYKLRRVQKTLDMVVCGERSGALGTAQMVAKAFRKRPVPTLDALLAKGGEEEVTAWLRTLAGDAVVALVGQEPDLGRLAGFLTSGKPNRVLALQACGICCIDCEGVPWAAGGMLRWLLTPMQLKKLKV